MRLGEAVQRVVKCVASAEREDISGLFVEAKKQEADKLSLQEETNKILSFFSLGMSAVLSLRHGLKNLQYVKLK